MTIIRFLAFAVFLILSASGVEARDIVRGEFWLDTSGNPINAHGGGILYHDGKYYWYGEYKTGKTVLPDWATWECYRTDVTGISCYSSPNMVDWTFEGIVLPAVPADPSHDLHPSKVLERPKVIYNAKTGKFVMWAHVDSAEYGKAAAGVAVSDSPTGPFTYLGSFRPNDAMSRDQTLFVDDDGKAYQFSSSENNRTLHINELTDDYLRPSGRYVRRFIGESREAPAVFKHNGKYYMLSSGCTGWDPNEAEIAVSDSIMGEWTSLGNPCIGKDADKTFYGQSTYVQPVYGKENCYVAMFDRWNKTDLENSRYIWLPLTFEDGRPIIRGSATDPFSSLEKRKLPGFRLDWPRDSIRLSDPCILADEKSQKYYMTGTGGRLWVSENLDKWTGPYKMIEHDTTSWMGTDPAIWAAELHQYNGLYYCFATFTNNDISTGKFKNMNLPRRASHILVSDVPWGPYRPISDENYLPENRPTLDGTFWADSDGKPYMVYCGEWISNWDGTMESILLKDDLSGAIGDGKLLFKASASPWSREKIDGKIVPNRVTDGPWLFRTDTGRLGMIWTSWIYDVYTQGVAYSESGTINGPWIQEENPVTPPDHGHGMLFKDLSGRWLMSVHSHRNDHGNYIRIPQIFEVDLSGDKLKIGKKWQ